MTNRKRIALVAAHFPPSNLAAVHRSRLWAQHLPEFGWEPIIVTTHWKYYEEALDSPLLQLVSPDLRVIRTKAFPVKPVRIIGDIGARALYWHFKALDELIIRKEIDFVHITIPSNFSALLGELLYRRHRFPFGIDYIDPWVHIWPAAKTPFSKARVSYNLSKMLEPWAVKNASLITGVAPLYYEPVLKRNPHLCHQCVSAAMPYGNSEGDYRSLRELPRETFLFPKDDGLFHMIYAGAMLPKAEAVLERLLEALTVLRDKDPEIMQRLRIHFVGTGTSPSDPRGHNIQSQLQRFGLNRWVGEHPNRIGYVDVLNHLIHASAILIVGSTEAHYTPSKVYQAVQAKRPMFALLHEQSTAVNVLRESRAGQAVTFTDDRLPAPGRLAEALAAFIRDPQYSADEVRWSAFEAYSARNSARMLASAVESALALFQRREACGTTTQSMQSAAR
jgi:hypothetical protein